MAEQSLLAKLGLRLGAVGSSVALVIAAPLAAGNYNPSCHTDAARTGWFFDTTAIAQKVGMVVGGQLGMFVNYETGVHPDITASLNSASPTYTLGTGVGKPHVFMNGTSGTIPLVIFTTATIAGFRCAFSKGNAAESGANAGSPFNIQTYDDTAVGTGTVICGRVTTAAFQPVRPLVISGGTFTGSQILIDASITWNDAAVAFTAMFMGATNTASAAGSLICDFKVNTITKFSINITGPVVTNSTDDSTGVQTALNRAFTLTGAITDTAPHIQSTQAVAGAFTITRLNWFSLNNPTGTSTITDACVYRFNAAAGTHKCIDSGTTKTTPTTVSAWDKYNINGTLYFSPCYTSKTS